MRTISDIQKMPIAALEKLMRESEFDTRDRAIIATEINARLLKSIAKPHWTLVPVFWVALVAAVAGVLALGVAVYALPQAQKFFHPIASGQPPQTTKLQQSESAPPPSTQQPKK
jgi:hypothetical protein